MDMITGGLIQPLPGLSSTSPGRAEDVKRETPVKGQAAGKGTGSPSSSKVDETAAPPKTAEAPVSQDQTPTQIAKEVERILKSNDSILSFELDKDLNQIIVKVIDPKTQEILKQYPPEEIVKMARSLRTQTGLLLDKRI